MITLILEIIMIIIIIVDVQFAMFRVSGEEKTHNAQISLTLVLNLFCRQNILLYRLDNTTQLLFL